MVAPELKVTQRRADAFTAFKPCWRLNHSWRLALVPGKMVLFGARRRCPSERAATAHRFLLVKAKRSVRNLVIDAC